MASAVLAMPSHAADAGPALSEIISKDAAATLAQAAKELKAAQGAERNFVKQLDTYAAFEFSPELRPKLQAIFGSERPFRLERVEGGAKGQFNYVGSLAPYTYQQDNGTDFSWTGAMANITTDKAGRTISSTGAWPSLLVTRPGSTFSVVNMTMNARQQRGADGVAYGHAQFNVGALTVRKLPAGGDSKEALRLDDIAVRSEVNRRGALAEIGYRTSIKAVVVGDQQVDRVNLALRVTNVPAKAMAELDKVVNAQHNSKLSDDEQARLMLKNLESFGKRAAVAGATLVIDDISAAYRGNVASLKGRIGFQKATEADFKNPGALLKKLVANFELRLPVALVKDVSHAFAARNTDATAPDAQGQIAKASDAMASMVVGKSISSGFAVMDKDVLRSAIQIRNGKLTVNGKEVDVAGQLKTLGAKIFAPKAQPAPELRPDVQPEPAAEQ